MARSRIGGSSGLLSGKVGDVIYSITRNADGSYRQQLGINPESRFNPNTDAQARARMTMGLIERAMFTYVDFMGTGFEGVDLGTNSVSRFSELNYNAIKYEIEEYWNMEDWPDWSRVPSKAGNEPERWMLHYIPWFAPVGGLYLLPACYDLASVFLCRNYTFARGSNTPSVSRAK